jgi:hypothetical protein
MKEYKTNLPLQDASSTVNNANPSSTDHYEANVEQDTQPFVNEECGDTMWDAVLKQEERKASLKPDEKQNGLTLTEKK